MSSKLQDRATCAAKAAHFALALAFAAPAAIGAVPVEESIGTGQRAAPVAQQSRGSEPAYLEPGMGTAQAQGAQSAPDDARRLSELFYQLQLLQQELQELRGTVEEQGHQLERISRDQKEQYIDLDRRVAELRNNTSAPAVATTPTQVAPPSSRGSGSERDAYTNAFNLMKNRQFDESADAFNKLIVDYPNGQFTPNAFYWLGELYLARTEYEKARQSFAQVVNLYPDHQKVPDALYKLGVVYHRLGDTQRSLEYLGKVRAEYPQSSAAGLAETYAAELQ